MTNQIVFNEITLEEMQELFKAMGAPRYRALQAFKAIHQQHVRRLEDITILPTKLRTELIETTRLKTIETMKEEKSNVDNTIKYLFRLEDGALIETVLMDHEKHRTLCVSTQVGCKMGCTFCASTKAGYRRDLSASEMLLQIYEVEDRNNIRIDNIVLMGIGEPLDNFKEVFRFIQLLNHKEGHETGIRHFTLSTCGLIAEIEQLIEMRLPINLAISLHNPIQKEREEMMPIAKTNPLEDLMMTLRRYQKELGRRITFEYVLVEGKNDSVRHVKALQRLLRGLDAHVNLIELNETKEYGEKKSTRLAAFSNDLTRVHINHTLRRKKGTDINAACGQLRNKNEKMR